MARVSRPTMNDVARSAGVSQTTVSFVLNNVDEAGIAEETRERVMRAVEELGYRPNLAAQALRTRYSHLVGLVTDEIVTSPFAGNIVKAAQECAAANNKMLVVVNSGGDPELESAAYEMLLQRQVDGIVYAAMYLRRVAVPAAAREVPTVLVNCYDGEGELPSIISDEQFGGHSATEILLAKGHRRVAFINGEEPFDAARARLAGYRAALEGQGIEYDSNLVSHGNWWPDNGYLNTRKLIELSDPPTAIFCGNDRIAIGAYQAVKELGLRIPADVAVLGYDGEEIGAHLSPPLSTFLLPHEEMGKRGVEYLVRSGGEESGAAEPTEKIRGHFIARESC